MYDTVICSTLLHVYSGHTWHPVKIQLRSHHNMVGMCTSVLTVVLTVEDITAIAEIGKSWFKWAHGAIHWQAGKRLSNTLRGG